MSRRILRDGRLYGLWGVSYSIDQLCLEPILNARLDVHLSAISLACLRPSPGIIVPSIPSVLQVNGEAFKSDHTVICLPSDVR